MVQPVELRLQFVLAFPAVRIEDDAIYGADLLTLRLIMMTYALGAALRIHLVVLSAHGDRHIRTLGLTYRAIDAFICNH